MTDYLIIRQRNDIDSYYTILDEGDARVWDLFDYIKHNDSICLDDAETGWVWDGELVPADEIVSKILDEVADCRGGAAKQTRCEIMSGDDLLTELVGNASTLAELRDALDSVEFSGHYDTSNLPTFGGPDVDYDEVWSWDEDDILLACYRGLGQYEYEIVERCPTCRVKPIECCGCEY